MSFKRCTLAMQITSGALVPTRIAELYAGLGEVFVPYELSFLLDNAPQTRLARLGSASEHSMTLWLGEQIDRPLTRIQPDPARDLVDELRRSLAGRSATTGWVSASGALRHRASGDVGPVWYGRWLSTEALRELVEVRFEWSEDVREIEITFPLNGYPVMPTALRDDLTIVDGPVQSCP